MRQGFFIMSVMGLGLVTACAPASAPPPAPPAPPPPAAVQPAPPPPPAAATPAPRAPAPAPVPQASNDGMPDGPGKAETVAACSGCHGLGQLMGEHRDREAWTTTVTSMINNGAPVADADFDKVVGYLTAHFGPA
jgi:hypothetical protein